MVNTESITGNEAGLGEFLETYSREHGLTAKRQYCTPERFNVIITYPLVKHEDKPLGLLLHGHYDTVPALDMEHAFTPVIEDGWMKGRGTVDQKAGIAASLTAMISVLEQKTVLDHGVSLACVIDEESEHRGSMKLVEEGIEAECAIVTEPSGLRAVIGCKGTLPVHITVKGKAAHGCRPWLGVNAVQKAMPILKRLFELEFKEKDFGVGLGILKNSINVGVVKAGSAYNNVPDRCDISLDCRIIPGDTNEAMLSCLKKVIEDAGRQDPELETELTVDRPDWDWDPVKERGLKSAITPKDSSLFHEVKAVHQDVTGALLESYITDGYADMDFLVNDLGIPTILYGPGNPRLCHSAGEHIELKEVETAMKVYEGFIRSHCLQKD
jgi:acetylornithine deacetylase/succinyl-diaminopimelate desuccinylase family protein